MSASNVSAKLIGLWFAQVFARKKTEMMTFMETCAQNGEVKLLKNNINWFKIDLCVDMFNEMEKEGYTVDTYNLSFKFDYTIEKEMKIFTKTYLVAANRVAVHQWYNTRSSSKRMNEL